MAQESPGKSPDPGALLAGRYRLEAILGRGVSGAVYRAFDTRLRRRVAVKLMSAATGAAAEQRAERLKREARALAALDHPNIVGVYDVGDEQGRPFIVMELVDGDSIASR